MLPFVCLSRLSQFYQLSIHPHKEEAGDPGLPFLRDRRCTHSRFQLKLFSLVWLLLILLLAEEKLIVAENSQENEMNSNEVGCLIQVLRFRLEG